MKVTLSYKADEEYVVVNETGQAVHIDMLHADQKQHMSPVQLVASALIACAAVDIVSMIKKRRKTFIDLKGEASYERREEHPRAITTVNLHYIITSPDLTEEEADRIVSLATTKYCSVAGSLNAEQTHSFEIVR